MSHYSKLGDIPFGVFYSSYFLDADVSDIDLWPLPILALQRTDGGKRDYAKEVSVHLIRLQGEVNLKPIPALKALNLHAVQSMNHLAEVMADISSPESARKLAAVRYLDAGGGVFLVQMKNGTSYLLRKADLNEADSTAVVSCVLSEDGEYFEVAQSSGNEFEVPWDDVLYHCEPSYEYFKRSNHQDDLLQGRERASRIGARIRELRVEKDMSVSDLARNIGMQRSNLSRVESGKHLPSLDTLERIAEALGSPVARLIAKQSGK